MNLNVLVTGVVSGVLYALSAVSLVIVYRASRMVNFGLGGMGGLAAYFAYEVLTKGGPYYLGFIVAMAVGAIVSWATEFLVIRRLVAEQHIVIGMVTLGVLLVLQGTIFLFWGPATYVLPKVYGYTIALKLGSVIISANDLFVVGLSLVMMALMYVLVRYTRLGLRMRATAEGAVSASVLGVNVRSVSSWSWTLGGIAGGVAAVLVTPITTLYPTSFTNFLFFAFAAVVLGGLTSAAAVLFGGILFGVLVNVVSFYLPGTLTETLSLCAVLIVLLLRPSGIFGVRERRIAEVAGLRSTGFRAAGARWQKGSGLLGNAAAGRIRALVNARPVVPPVSSGAAARKRLIQWTVAAVVLAVLPWILHGAIQTVLPTFAASILGVLSITVLYGVAGRVSVGNGALMAVGAYTAAILVHQTHMPFFAAMAIAGIASFGIGALVGLPSLRVQLFVYFAVYTFMVANAVPELIQYYTQWTGGQSGIQLAPPSFVGRSVLAVYWMCLIVTAAVMALVALLLRSRIGRRWRAAADSQLGAAAVGVNVPLATVLAFAVSGLLAGLSGVLQGAAVGEISSDSYSIWVSIYVVLGAIVGGSKLISGAVVGAAFITFVPYWTGLIGASLSPDLVFGVVLILVVVLLPTGLVRGVTQMGNWLLRMARALVRMSGSTGLAVALAAQGAGAPGDHVPDDPEQLPESVALSSAADPAAARSGGITAAPATLRPAVSSAQALLTVRSLSVAYEDLVAVRGVNLVVHEGEIVALLGPNGAGKSSVARAISGVAKVRTGTVEFAGQSLVGLPPWEITRKGIGSVVEGRAIFPGLTVDENLTLGAFAAADKGRRQAQMRSVVMETFPDLAGRRRQLGGTLSGGQQQMLAIGRALMAETRLLVLDEPSLGLSPHLAQVVFDSLASMRREVGLTMLVIEQNSALALELADTICLLRGGEVRLTCRAQELREDSNLINDYLGLGAMVGGQRA